MSHVLTVELPDEVYESLRRLAEETGRRLDEVALDWLRRRAAQCRQEGTAAATDEAWRELLAFAGAASLGRATGVDNEAIDADLAREAGGSKAV